MATGDAGDKGPHLGQTSVGSVAYDPSLLHPVPRANARSALPRGDFHGYGEDLWHAYELSWLDNDGIPVMFVGTLAFPSLAPNIIESKSLKLYFNSLNNHRFASVDDAVAWIRADLSAVAGAEVGLEVDSPDGALFGSTVLTSSDLDVAIDAVPDSTDASLLLPVDGDDYVHTHRLRSLCPVTAQPDWATVIIHTRGKSAARAGLLAYLLAYRNHQEFHEQCVERIFTDLQHTIAPGYLSVQALYTRRGGLDICPWRSSEDEPSPRIRLDRQ